MNREKIRETIDNFQTNSEYGFTNKEMQQVIDTVGRESINEEKMNNAMYGNTCMRIDGEIITYHGDFEKALICGLENRDLTLGEWD